ncbi:phosphopentomutase [Microvirga aerophila]|uniref:Phosphopentomutase n=1 Tax=Microvirga aerophila TaxID=670291 RepID=A0A512BVD5_9HYPH|nr:phosphopentomutase [Microvirga aerophila]GEO15928.1 phosphopentomutase [Microvirga aerophila]
MPRALLIVLDSVGIGGAEDASAYGDAGADTLGHIAEACAAGGGDRAGLRQGPLHLPHMAELGLGLACEASTGRMPPNLEPKGSLTGSWGYGVETSRGKDTPSGHWEIAGVPVDFEWGYFPDTVPSFPKELTDALIERAGLPGILGNKHASGTAIIDELGAEYMRTSMPICYTSVDSVLQIAAHEETFGLQRLYDLCRIGRELCDDYKIGRVIARPFVGSAEAGFKRTGNRKDFATPPPSDTILDILTKSGRSVVTVGKIGDIFAHRSTGHEVKPNGNDACLSAAIDAMKDLPDGGFVFANLVDFDSEYGHRRDIPGYASALEAFDRRVPEIEASLRPGDLVIITADHGNDPSWRGTDHTREHIPILCFGPDIKAGTVGKRSSFADIGASVLTHLGAPQSRKGKSWL